MTLIDWFVPMFTLAGAAAIQRFWQAVDAACQAEAKPDPVLLEALQRSTAAGRDPAAIDGLRGSSWPA